MAGAQYVFPLRGSTTFLCSALVVHTIEGSHVHGDGGDEALALVELALQQLAEHVQGDELVAVQDGAFREGAETNNFIFSNLKMYLPRYQKI